MESEKMKYEVVIGIEVHIELSTKTKIFCSCTTEFGGDVNTHCCPICTGMPGTLPVINETAVMYCVKAGLATNCDIANYSKLDRKNYFYPDLPKAYQVSQFDLPLCAKGFIDIETDSGVKRIGITRIHIEEDAGKLLHDARGTFSLIDYNRCGVPLIEIVSEPDMRSAEEAKAYVEKLRTIMMYIGVSDCKMQEGSLRADVNLSVRPVGQKEFGTRTEMKNLNSFRSIVRAIEDETQRQITEIENSGVIVQETRRWDDDKGISYSMRSKEEAHDYRYFPEPDLVPVELTDELINKMRDELPELPTDRVKRYISEFGIPEYDAKVIIESKNIADLFEETVSLGADSKKASNFIMGELMRIIKDKESDDIPFTAEYFAKILDLINKGFISDNIAKKVFGIMFETGKDPGQIVKDEGLEAVNDESQLSAVADEVIKGNQKSVDDYIQGKEQALGFLMGQVMKATRGKANPQIISRLLKEKLDGLH